MHKILKLACLLPSLFAAVSVKAQIETGQPAPAMLPLLLSDGSTLDLDKCEGKVVVLYFYEQQCPTCRQAVPELNKLIETNKDKPVRFVAVGAGDSASEVQQYAASTKLVMPVTPDPLSLLERSWGFSISLNNIRKTRVIDAKGILTAYQYDGDFYKRALATAKWKYDREGYDPAFVPVLDAFEWNNLENGAKLLKQAKRGKKSIAESATKLEAILKTEYQSTFDEAASLVESDPVAAYDRFNKVSTVMADDPLAKEADEKIKTLKTNAAVKDELAARKMFDQLAATVIKAKKGQEADIGGFAKSIIKKYPDTPTAKRVEKIIASWQ